MVFEVTTDLTLIELLDYDRPFLKERKGKQMVHLIIVLLLVI